MLNEILNSLGEVSLYEHKDFYFDKDLNYNHWTKIKFKRENSIQINFEITNRDFRLDIDRIEEALYISYDDLIENKKEIKNFIVMIFTSLIRVEYCGKRYTKIFFVAKNGIIIDSIEFYKNTFFRFKYKCQEITYTPIFPEGSEG